MDSQQPMRSDWEEEWDLTGRIVEEVASREGTEPTALTPPLYSVIDPEALERLMRAPNWEGTVEFSYLGYEITVSRGDVIVENGH